MSGEAASPTYLHGQRHAPRALFSSLPPHSKSSPSFQISESRTFPIILALRHRRGVFDWDKSWVVSAKDLSIPSCCKITISYLKTSSVPAQLIGNHAKPGAMIKDWLPANPPTHFRPNWSAENRTDSHFLRLSGLFFSRYSLHYTRLVGSYFMQMWAKRTFTVCTNSLPPRSSLASLYDAVFLCRLLIDDGLFSVWFSHVWAHRRLWRILHFRFREFVQGLGRIFVTKCINWYAFAMGPRDTIQSIKSTFLETFRKLWSIYKWLFIKDDDGVKIKSWRIYKHGLISQKINSNASFFLLLHQFIHSNLEILSYLW